MKCEWHISESVRHYMEYIFCIAHSLDLVGVYSTGCCEYALNCSFMFFIILCFLDIVLTAQTAEVPQVLLNLNRTRKSARAVCTKITHKKWYRIYTNLEELHEYADTR
jgi:hypothetical protein